jgi:choline-sulfatase
VDAGSSIVMRTVRLAFCAVVAGALASCSRPAPQRDSALSSVATPEEVRRAVASIAAHVDNVVLITVDALRSDQPWTGEGHASTPNLSRLATASVVYTRAYGLATITTASLNGMLASRYPSELSRDACIFGKFDLARSLVPTLKSARVATFAAHGHAIFAGVTAPSLGFDEWKLVRGAAGRLQEEGAVTGAETADLMIQHLEHGRPRERKTFAWAHFVDPHDTYAAHADFPPSSPGARGLYDAEVAYTDAAIGRVLDAIDRAGIADRTAVIVTADHGEAFGEHGNSRHGFTLYEEEVRIPLLVHVPGLHGFVIDTPRSAIDVTPTIAELLGIAPPANWKGVSLLHDLPGRLPDARPVIVDIPEMSGRTPSQAVIVGSTKVMLDASTDGREMAPMSGPPKAAAEERAKRELTRIERVDASPCTR